MSTQIPVVTTNPVPCSRDMLTEQVSAFVNGRLFSTHEGSIHIFAHQYEKYGNRSIQSVSGDELMRVGVSYGK